MPNKADSFGQIATAAPSLLGQLAAGAAGGGTPQTPPSPSPSPGGRGKGGVHANGQGIDLDAFIAYHRISVTRTEPHDGGTRYILDHCLFDPSHTGTSACLGRAASGAVWYKCHHDSCSGRGWKDLREHLEGPRPAKGRPKGKKPSKKPAAGGDADELPESAWLRAQEFIQDCWMDDLGRMPLRYHRRRFWRFDGICYRAINDSEVEGKLVRWMGPRAEKITGRAVADVLMCLRSVCGLPDSLEPPIVTGWHHDAQLATWGEDRRQVAIMANGVLDLEILAHDGPEAAAAAMTPRSPDLFAVSALGFPFDPAAAAPRWMAFLAEVFEDNQECADLLGEWMGYCLTPDTSRQKIMLLNGPVRAGKGTIIRTLKTLIGDNAFGASTFTRLGRPYGLSHLLNKSVCFLPDAHVGHGPSAMCAMEILKNISGEDDVNIEIKYQEDVRARLGIRFMVACNELPKFGDSSQTVASRLLALPFRVSFLGREDYTLEAKLAGEAPGIFNWAIAGLRRLRDQGFTAPIASEPVLAEFRELSSPLATFLEDCCTVGRDLEVARDDLWKCWSNWCQANGHRAGSRELLGSRLRGLIPTLDSVQRRGIDGLQKRSYVGLGINLGLRHGWPEP